MTPLERKKANRLKFLHKLYEHTDGNVHADVDMFELGSELGFDEMETEAIYNYLSGENLLEGRFVGGGIGITHRGVREVEKALSEPQQPTHYFPPFGNVIHIGQMSNSVIQQGSHGSTQNVTITPEHTGDLKEFLSELKAKLPELGLPSDDQEQASAQIATIETQLQAPKPINAVISAAGSALQGILLGVGGNWATTLIKLTTGFGP